MSSLQDDVEGDGTQGIPGGCDLKNDLCARRDVISHGDELDLVGERSKAMSRFRGKVDPQSSQRLAVHDPLVEVDFFS